MRYGFAILMTAALLSQSAVAEEPSLRKNHPYAGTWVTDGGRIRHELFPNSRYIKARGTRECL
jgi:hypothetical protein